MNKLDLITVGTERSQPDELDVNKKVFYLNDYDDLSVNFFKMQTDGPKL